MLSPGLHRKILLPTLGIVMAAFAAMYLFSVPSIRRTAHQLEEDAAKTILDNVCFHVDTIHQDIEAYRKYALESHKAKLKDITMLLDSSLHGLLQDVEKGVLNEEAAKQRALTEFRRFRYGNDDYVWVSDYNSVLIAHPDPSLNNVDFSQKTDVYGNPIVPPMVEVARRHGEGYTRYWWRRLGQDRPIEKLTYSRHFPQWGWVFGTGVYIDDVELEVEKRKQAAIEELRKILSQVKIARTGYLYVFDATHRLIIHPNPDLEGKNASHLISVTTGRKILDDLMDAARSPEGKLHYKWNKLSDKEHYVYDKISWVKYHPGFDWYIASSVYTEEIDSSAEMLSQRIFLVSAVVCFLLVGTLSLLIRRLLRPVRELSSMALQVKQGDLSARAHVVANDEIGILAMAFNEMVEKLQDNLTTLDLKVRERTAELELANEKLTQLDRMKTAFLSSVSHELRTPLTSIRGFAKLIRKDFIKFFLPRQEDAPMLAKAERIDKNLEIIIQEGERLTRLINDVLDLAKIESGKLRWQNETIAIRDLILEAIELSRGQFAAKEGVALRMEETADELPMIQGDHDRLLQVLLNLLSNAIKFTDQ
ncbi:MAG: cache domain-containing protein, partial [Thermodesulfobacteriota bacterium]